MKLSEFLSVIGNEDVDVILKDYKNLKKFMEFKAAGYQSLDESVLDREVKNVNIDISKNSDRTPLIIPLKTPLVTIVVGDVQSQPTYEYVVITPTGNEDPKALGWYEKVEEEFVLTEDTTVDAEKVYYEKKEVTIVSP